MIFICFEKYENKLKFNIIFLEENLHNIQIFVIKNHKLWIKTLCEILTILIMTININLSNTFWENFSSNLLAGVIISLIFSYLLVKWLNFYNRPKLKLIAEKKDLPNEKEVKGLILSIFNSGNKHLTDREANFHLYIPIEITISPEYLQKTGIQEMGNIKINKKKYIHYSQFNLKPIFPKRQISIAKIFYPKTENVYKIYYHFSTIYGLMPKRGRYFQNISKRNGEIKVERLHFVKVD